MTTIGMIFAIGLSVAPGSPYPVKGGDQPGRGPAMATTRKPLMCRLNLHHRWETAKTGDGKAYVRCARCLKERGGPLDDSRTTAGNVISNYGSMN